MTVIKISEGQWAVVDSETAIAGPFTTSAEAWRWIDRHEGEPISPAERRADWLFRKTMGGAV